MSDRGIESLSGLGAQGIAPKNEGAKDLTTKEILALPIEKFEERLDDVFSEESNLGSLTQPERKNPGENETSFVEQAAAMAVVIPLLGGAGVAAAETVSPSDAKAKSGTEIVSKFEGEIPSKIALDKMTAKASAGVSDVTPAAQPTPLGPEATPSVLDIVTPEYIKETLRLVEDMKSPLPVERMKNCLEAWRIREYGKYAQELRSLGLELESFVECGAKALYAYEKSTLLTGTSYDKFQNYILRDEIIGQLLAGEKEKNLKKREKIMKNYLLDNDGNPVIAVVSATDSIGVDKTKKGLKDAIKTMEKDGFGDVYKSIRESGASVWFTAELQPGKMSGRGLINEWGVINQNMSKKNTKGVDISKQVMFLLPVEPIGISCFQINKAFGRDIGFGVDDLSKGILEVAKVDMAYEIVNTFGNKKPYIDLARNFTSVTDVEEVRGNISVKNNLVQYQKELIYAVYDVVGENLLKKKE